MPIKDYNGETFVAYIDISGFKVLMQQDKAIQAIDSFYSIGYHSLSGQNNNNLKVEGIFVSDCGILFVNKGETNTLEESLALLLNKIERINVEMLHRNYMLTTSIAFGHFSYHQRIEYLGIEKNPIYGNAYVKAFLDNENGRPKLEPGKCRILKDSLLNLDLNRFPVFDKIKEEKNHLYFYWMVNQNSQIDNFESEYSDTYNLKFEGMIKALKNSVGIN